MQGLQEIEEYSLDSSYESQSPSQSVPVATECVQKIANVQHIKAENINVLQNANKDARKSSFESGDNIDNVLSGESLYKTFTFEQSSDEDLEKCIAFWKSVMQKNLEPIKCSIIESSKTKVPGEQEKMESIDLDISEELHKTEQNMEEKIHEYYKNLFTTALKELQRKRLNEVKLIGKTRCKMCEAQISQSEDVEIEQTDDIVGLNDWKPKSIKKDINNKIANQETTDGKELSEKPTKTTTCICEPPPDTYSIDTAISDQARVEPDTNRYKLINIIDEKKRTGAYSRWRKNIIEPCTCGVDVCDCNLNPAIVSSKLPDETCGCGQLQCQCKIIQQGEGKITEKTDVEEQDQQCLCGHEICTCNAESAKLIKSQDIIPVSPPSSSNDITHSISTLYEDTQFKPTQSKETIIVKSGEAGPRHTEDSYQVGLVKKSSKANVTKCDDTGSHITLISNKIDKEECLCKEVCGDCLMPKISENKVTNNIQK